MKQTLLGYRGYEFDDRQTGRKVQGVSLYTMYDSDAVRGHEAGRISVRQVPSNIDDFLGAEINVEFDQRGKVRQILWPSSAPAGRPVASGAGGGK